MVRGTMITVTAIAAALMLGTSAGAAKGVPDDFYGVVPQEPFSGSDYQRLTEGRVGTVRIPFLWGFHQAVKGRCQARKQIGVCNWLAMDEVMARLALAGVRPVANLYGSPYFVYGKHPTKPPLGKALKGWKRFLTAAAKRYGPGGIFWRSFGDAYGSKPQPVTEWQVWNEPNSDQFWHPRPNPRRYAKLVKASSRALKDGDRSARVVLGGMFTDAEIPFGAFMRRFYRVDGVRSAFDEAAVHPYARTVKRMGRRLKQARRTLRRNHDRHAGIRITELGWSSATGDNWLMRGPEGQAKLLREAFELITEKRARWNITGVNWFALRDTKNKDTCAFCHDSGLLQVGGGSKPAWEAFKRFSDPRTKASGVRRRTR
jgi:hypothetical protein